jgi:hypothetical protein
MLSVGGDAEKPEPSPSVGANVAAALENIVNIYLSSDSAVSLLPIYPRQLETGEGGI